MKEEIVSIIIVVVLKVDFIRVKKEVIVHFVRVGKILEVIILKDDIVLNFREVIIKVNDVRIQDVY